MGDRLRSRVRERLDAKGLNPFEAARMAGLERSYVNDLLIGKKQTIREKKLPALASILDCDPDYLTGAQDTPRRGGGRPGMRMAGIVEAGAWRSVDAPASSVGGSLPIEPDPRFPSAEQEAYRVRGDHAVGLGILDASILCIATMGGLEAVGRRLRDGDIVLVRQSNGRLFELTARVYEETREGVRLSARPSIEGEFADFKLPDVEIVGLVLRSIRVFGLPT